MGASTIEFAIGVPLMLLLVLVTVHIGFWYNARNVVTAAAEEGARTVRVPGATDAEGEARVTQFLDDVGAHTIINPTVTITHPDPETVSVTVSGQAPAVVGGLGTSVAATVTSPVEGFRAA